MAGRRQFSRLPYSTGPWRPGRRPGRFEEEAPPTPEYASDDFSEEAVQSRAEQAAADPESFYADLIIKRDDDWWNRFFPIQQEAIDIAMGNDRERRAMELGKESLGPMQTHHQAVMEAHRNVDPMDPKSLLNLLRVSSSARRYYDTQDEIDEQYRNTGFRMLAGQERQEVGETTRKAFDIGADVGNRTRQRYGLDIGQSATQQRGRDVNQALATVGGVNSMRDGLRDRQDYLMTGSSSAMSGIMNQMGA
jgi:hypothetical protein